MGENCNTGAATYDAIDRYHVIPGDKEITVVKSTLLPLLNNGSSRLPNGAKIRRMGQGTPVEKDITTSSVISLNPGLMRGGATHRSSQRKPNGV